MAEIESKPSLLKTLKLPLAPKVDDGQALEVTKLAFIRMQHTQLKAISFFCSFLEIPDHISTVLAPLPDF